VRVRIIRRLTGSVDGIDLTPFRPGEVYDVSTTLGSYLLCVRVAEPAPDDAPALGVPLGNVRTASEPLSLKPPVHRANRARVLPSDEPASPRPVKRR
jgi:hypothetical protein